MAETNKTNAGNPEAVANAMKAAAAAGDVARVAELSKALMDTVGTISDEGNIFKGIAAVGGNPIASVASAVLNLTGTGGKNELVFIEDQKKLAYENYKKNTGKSYVPQTANEVLLGNLNGVDGDGRDIVDAYKKKISEAYKLDHTFVMVDANGQPVTDASLATGFKRASDTDPKIYTSDEVNADYAQALKANYSYDPAQITAKDGKFIYTKPDGSVETIAPELTDWVQGAVTHLQQQVATGQTAAGIGIDKIDATATVREQMRKFGVANGIAFTEDQLDGFVAQQGLYGDVSAIQADYRARFIAPRYPALADTIKQGYNVADIAQSYIEKMNNVLELNPADTVSAINDPLVQRALNTVGPDGKPSYVPAWQFDGMIRKDPRYQATNAAAVEYSNLTSAIKNVFEGGPY